MPGVTNTSQFRRAFSDLLYNYVKRCSLRFLKVVKMRDGMLRDWSRRRPRNAGAALRRSQTHSLRPLAPRRVSWFPTNAGLSELVSARSTRLESCPPAPGNFD